MTKAAMELSEEMFHPSQASSTHRDEVLVAPIVSEKATAAAEKNKQVLFKVCATRPSRRSRRLSS